MADESGKPSLGAGVLTFLSNPWVTAIAGIAGIIGLPLSIYFFYASIRAPEVVYYVHPARAVVVKQGASSRLAVAVEGRAIKEDLTAAQFAIWNRGSDSVRQHAILKPVVIRTGNNAPIVEATVRKKSRDVVRFEIDQSKMADGEILVSWNVLEPGDGGILQLVYAGDPNVDITASGIFEGQPTLTELRYRGTIKSASDQVREESGWKRWLTTTAVLVSALWMALSGYGTYRQKADKSRSILRRVFIFTALVIGPVVIMIVVIYHLVFYAVPNPPFGFE